MTMPPRLIPRLFAACLTASLLASLAACGGRNGAAPDVGTGRNQIPPTLCAGPCPPIPQPNYPQG